MLNIDDTVLVLLDVQGKLASVMHEKEDLFANLVRLVSGLSALDVPVIWLEQNPEKMGRTISELQELLPGREPICKMSFSACGDDAFIRELEGLGRRQVLLAGIEAHICVAQTAMDLVSKDYEVEVVADAVSSRTAFNKAVGLEKSAACGAQQTSVESALFELLKSADHPAFREILKIVK
jgi:nicotinamidase-related amidase